ncbi:MAG: glycosyltransferase family 2 protein [Isosphaeraceae bacterium]
MNAWFVWVVLALQVALLPYFLLLLVAATAAILARRRNLPVDEPRSRLLVMIPAHDEETGIAATVASCQASDYPAELVGVLVIADNCTDQTAAVARAAGARVVERSDASKKSKGYAIESTIAKLVESGEFDRLDALVFVDADTTIDRDLLRWFDADLRAGHDWIQCYYTVANPNQSWRTRLMTYAFALFNGVMPKGLNAVGISAGLRGNGMCFSTRGLRRRPWVAYGLVEDMEFSWILRLSGESVAFEPATRVYGAMLGSGGKAAANQRRRWEFGRKEIRRKYTPQILRAERMNIWERLISLGEITMPTMGVLLASYVVLAALGAGAIAWTWPIASIAQSLLLVIMAAMTLAVGLYAVAPFLAMRLPLRYALSLARLPVYLVWKVVISIGGRPAAWIRTERVPQAKTPQPAGDGEAAPGDPSRGEVRAGETA